METVDQEMMDLSDEARRKERVLSFEAPYLTDKLVRSGVVADHGQAEALFCELKKYLFLAAELREPVPMMSTLVDAAWHQLILYTAKYEAFCRSTWGAYQHHFPREGRRRTDAEGAVTIAGFVEAYRRHFGPLHDLWHNERCLRAETRLTWSDRTLGLSVETSAGAALLVREGGERETVCRASLRAAPALAFLAAHRVFLVREVVGLRSLDEQLALLRPLVEFDVLNIAP